MKITDLLDAAVAPESDAACEFNVTAKRIASRKTTRLCRATWLLLLLWPSAELPVQVNSTH